MFHAYTVDSTYESYPVRNILGQHIFLPQFYVVTSSTKCGNALKYATTLLTHAYYFIIFNHQNASDLTIINHSS